MRSKAFFLIWFALTNYNPGKSVPKAVDIYVSPIFVKLIIIFVELRRKIKSFTIKFVRKWNIIIIQGARL